MSTQHVFPQGYLPPRALAGVAAGTPVGVALSGGADSVALLHILKTEGLHPLHALHVHHGIRGEEADRDEEFCRALCRALDIPLCVIRVDVPALAKRTGEGLETAARNARYATFSAFLKEQGLSLLVTAHHADDQLETLLQHLLRGCGLRGLCGIPAYREMTYGAVARPLLQVSKSAILAYCCENNLEFVTDSSNGEPCCPRNRLRAEVLPVLASLWPQGALSAARTAALLFEDERYLTQSAEEFLAREGRSPAVKALSSLPRPIFVRVMQALLPTPPEAVHVDALWELVQKAQPHASLSLPNARVAIENGALQILSPKEAFGTAQYMLCLQEGENAFPCGVAVLAAHGKSIVPPHENPYKYSTRIDFCSAIIKGKLCLRSRLAGDRILAGKRHKAVRKLPCMSRFSPAERARMPLLCDGDGVLAIPFGPVRDEGSKNPDLSLHLFFD